MALPRTSCRLLGIRVGLALLGLTLLPGPGHSKAADAETTNSPTAGPKESKHWAYIPPASHPRPSVRQDAWPRSPLDWFVLARLEANGLKPSPDAEPFTLCRRIYFDLLGLPPSPEELEAFQTAAVADRKRAIGELVERLLASPHFGEHWARHWLDVARFAESVTLRGFIFREAWRYRDYVIEAFNEDRPFDEFVREQIAGDLLDSETLALKQRRLIATTFLALGNTNLEEQDKKQLDMDVVDEQLDTLGKAVLGQTIGCARCHDHKFDPIPTRDYYAMAGILRNARLLKHANVSEWLESPLPLDPARESQLRAQESAIAAVEKEIQSAKNAAKAKAGATGESKAPSEAMVLQVTNFAGIVVDSSRARPVGEWKHSTYSKRYIGDGYLHDLNEGKGNKTLSFAPEGIAAGRYDVRLAYVHAPSRASKVPVTIFHADGETVVHVNQQEAPVLEGRFVSLGQFRFESNGFANVLVGTDGTQGFVTADAVQFISTEAPSERLTSQPAGPAHSSASGAETTDAVRIKTLEARLKKLKETGPRRPMVMAVREAEKIDDCPVHIRGSVHSLGAEVPRGFLTVASAGAAPPFPSGQSGRRELANWMAGAANPLTARVYVNRVWCWLFGQGLVRSVDNFGTTGDAPTHPELLDDLAVRFVRDGWSTKKLIHELILSRTYQQASGPTDADPENQWLARANRRRLMAEQMRDAILVVSGKLDREPPRGPTFPSERTADYGFVSTATQRSVYLPVFRNALPQFLEAFDFAPPSLVTGRRTDSTVSTQALFLLNDPFISEQAALAGRRLLKQPITAPTERIRCAFQMTMGRNPTDREMGVARRHVTSGDEETAWAELFHALFASADFRYLD
jgi:hypothetical protein